MNLMTTSSNSMALPTHQKAAVLIDQGPDFKFEVQAIPVQQPGPNEVLVELEVTGVCGTDLGFARGYMGQCNPILGHEGIGRIIALGSGVSSKIQINQLVGIGWVRDACGTCHVCLKDGGEVWCTAQVYSGRDVAGTLAQTTLVPERYITRLPEGIPAEKMAPIMCAGVTAYKGLKSCKAIPGSWVAVSGARGGVGSLAVQYGKAMGYRIVAIDAKETRRQPCMDLGAEAYIDFEQENDLKAAVLRVTGGHLCAGVVVCAGSAAAYETAIPCVDYLGTLVAVGIPAFDARVKLHPLSLIDMGITLVGSLVGSRGDIAEAMEFVKRKMVEPKVISIALEELNEYARKAQDLDGKLVVRMKE